MTGVELHSFMEVSTWDDSMFQSHGNEHLPGAL